MNTIKNVLNEFLAIKGAKFVSLVYTTKGHNELARYKILVGCDIERIYRRDYAVLRRMVRKTSLLAVGHPKRKALLERLASMRESLKNQIGNNKRFTRQCTFESLGNGVSKLFTSGMYHVKGIQVSKVKICKACAHEQNKGEVCESCKAPLGIYKKVNSTEKTLAKNEIRRKEKQSKIREFKLSSSQLGVAKLNGKTLEIV